MRICEAVKRSIEEGDDSVWSIFVKGGCSHHLHVSIRCAPDGFDAEIMRRLAWGLPSTRGGLTHVERRDGSLQPWIIQQPWFPGEERRNDPQPLAGGRRITDPKEEPIREICRQLEPHS